MIPSPCLHFPFRIVRPLADICLLLSLTEGQDLQEKVKPVSLTFINFSLVSLAFAYTFQDDSHHFSQNNPRGPKVRLNKITDMIPCLLIEIIISKKIPVVDMIWMD